jgi:hypothetical protein
MIVAGYEEHTPQVLVMLFGCAKDSLKISDDFKVDSPLV